MIALLLALTICPAVDPFPSPVLQWDPVISADGYVLYQDMGNGWKEVAQLDCWTDPQNGNWLCPGSGWGVPLQRYYDVQSGREIDWCVKAFYWHYGTRLESVNCSNVVTVCEPLVVQ